MTFEQGDFFVLSTNERGGDDNDGDKSLSSAQHKKRRDCIRFLQVRQEK